MTTNDTKPSALARNIFGAIEPHIPYECGSYGEYGKLLALIDTHLAPLVEALEEIAVRGPVEGYDSSSALRLRLVGSQTVARQALAKIK